MYYVTLEDDSICVCYYSKFKNRKLAEEYRNILILYFVRRKFRIKIRSSLCKIQGVYSEVDDYFEGDVTNLINNKYNSGLTLEKFQEYFHG